MSLLTLVRNRLLTLNRTRVLNITGFYNLIPQIKLVIMMRRFFLIYIIIIYLLGLALVITIIACNRDSYNHKDIKSIRFESKPKELINLSDFCSSISYIPLETNSKCYITKISRIKFFGDSIFIINQLFWNMKEILVFDITGKFLGTFGQIGPGPEEIDNPRDVIKINDSYLIWDKLKIAEFDYKGNFKRKLFNAFIPGENFFVESNKINLYHGTEFPGLITQYDFEGNLLRTYKPIDPKKYSSTFEGENLINIDNEYHFFAPSFDTVWMFSNNQILPRYIFDFTGDITLQKLFMKYPDKIPPEMAPILKSNSPSYVLSFFESKNYIFLKYLKSNNQSFKVISKINSHQIDFKHCNNNIDNGIFGTPISSIDDNFVIPLEPIQILKHRDNFNSPEQSTFNMIGQIIKEDDNPVLMFIKFKF